MPVKSLLVLLVIFGLLSSADAGQTPPPGSSGQIITNNGNGQYGAISAVPIGNGGTPPLTPFSSTSTAPGSLTMTLNGVYRKVNPASDLPPIISQDFNQGLDVNSFVTINGTRTQGQGITTLTSAAGTYTILQVQNLPVKVPQFFESIGINFAGGATTNDLVAVGLRKDGSNYVMAQVDNKANTWTVYCQIGGVNHNVSYSGSAAGYSLLGFSLTGNQASVWGWNGYTWVLVISENLTSYIDFGAQLSTGWYYTVWGETDSASKQSLYAFQVTPWGGVGARDFNFVTYENGEPFENNGNYFFTATIAAPNDANIATLCGVYTYNYATNGIKQVGRLIPYVSSRYAGASSCKIMFDRAGMNWWVFGQIDGGYLDYQEMDSSPLWNDVYLNNLARINPTGNAYDPDIYYDGTTWHLVYDWANYSGKLLHSTGATIAAAIAATPTQVSTANYTEGFKIRKIGGTAYILGIDETALTWPVWNLSNALIGTLPVTLVGDGACSHPNVMAVPDGLYTQYVGLTFTCETFTDLNGDTLSYSNGDVVLYKSQDVTGKEYQTEIVPYR